MSKHLIYRFTSSFYKGQYLLLGDGTPVRVVAVETQSRKPTYGPAILKRNVTVVTADGREQWFPDAMSMEVGTAAQFQQAKAAASGASSPNVAKAKLKLLSLKLKLLNL